MNVQDRPTVIDAQHVHVRQAHQNLGDPSRVLDHRRLQTLPEFHAVTLTAPPPKDVDPIPPSDPKSR